MLIYTDERMLDHQPRHGHPERPERLAAVLRHLRRTGQLNSCELPSVTPATNEDLERVHLPEYIAALGSSSHSNVQQVETDTWVSVGSEQAARLAAGAVVAATAAVLNGGSTRAACLVRPPGHHARAANPMGFCLYNSVAVGVEAAIKHLGVNRVLIVDWDVHHGNGTQELFYERADVAFLSIHRYPFYPGSGSLSETGTGAGLGFTQNLPLHFGVTRAAYLEAFTKTVEKFADKIRPELVILSAGFDAHREDPIGNLGLDNEDFIEMTRIASQVAATHAHNRLVSVLEGGYNCSVLAGCVSEHLTELICE